MGKTDAQQKDIDCVKYFIPTSVRHVQITSDDERMFLENSERGLHKERIARPDGHSMDGFNALIWGKVWRGRHVHELYEPGVLSGDMPYIVVLGGMEGDTPMPRAVVDFLKKEMFQGADADVIESCYQAVLAVIPTTGSR